MMNQGITISSYKELIVKAKKLADKETAEEHITQYENFILLAQNLLVKEKRFSEANYPAKLKFWDANNLYPFTWSYTVSKNEKSTPKIFSIHPGNAEERKLYFEWVVPHYKDKYPLRCDVEAIKANYYAKVSDNPQALEYTEREIAKFKLRRGQYMIQHREANSPYRLSYQDRLNPFKEGYDSVVDVRDLDYEGKPLVFFDIVLIQEGIVSAHIISFLEQQKSLLKYKLENPTAKEHSGNDEQKEKLSGIKNWNQRTRYYLLEKAGFFDTNYFRNAAIPQNEKHKLIANILNCSPRNAKKYFNREEQATQEEKEEVEVYLNALK